MDLCSTSGDCGRSKAGKTEILPCQRSWVGDVSSMKEVGPQSVEVPDDASADLVLSLVQSMRAWIREDFLRTQIFIIKWTMSGDG